MALNREVWLREIQENLFPDNSFVAKSIDDSAFVDNHRVHVPNAGAPSGVKRNRSVFPATVGTREDKDLTYDLEPFSTDPIRLQNILDLELSYDKRKSVIYNDKEALHESIHDYILEQWAKANGGVVRTSGELMPAHTHSGATGKRKKVTSEDILELQTQFDLQKIAQEGRYLLLDPVMYNKLLGSLSAADKHAFFATADAQRGILGQLYGFHIMKRAKVLRLKADAETILFDGEAHEATELGAGLAWQEGCVSRAIGETNMYYEESSPEYYGEVMSFDQRAGGSGRRFDKKGEMLLVEAAE